MSRSRWNREYAEQRLPWSSSLVLLQRLPLISGQREGARSGQIWVGKKRHAQPVDLGRCVCSSRRVGWCDWGLCRFCIAFLPGNLSKSQLRDTYSAQRRVTLGRRASGFQAAAAWTVLADCPVRQLRGTRTQKSNASLAIASGPISDSPNSV
jgi:hypothetical protein